MNDLFPDLQQQLNKLSIRKMQFQVKQIEFDFTDDIDDPLTDEYKQSVVDETLEGVWEACDDDDLVEEITSATGWCVNSIDYLHVLN